MSAHRTPWLRRALLLAFGAAVLTVLAVVADYVRELGRDDRPVAPGAEATIGGDFELTDADGMPVTPASFSSRHALVFFGFTHCPHVCPTTLARLSETLRLLGADADAVQVLFITVDPARDTPERLKNYRAPFDPRIRYLTGTDAQIAQAAAAYGVSYAKVALPDGNYTMDHTAALYLLTPDNRLAQAFAGSVSAPDLARAIRDHTRT